MTVAVKSYTILLMSKTVKLFTTDIQKILLNSSSEMMDLQTLLQPELSNYTNMAATSPSSTAVRLVSKPSQILVREKTQIRLMDCEPATKQQQQQLSTFSLLKPTSCDSENGSSSSSLLRSALTRKTTNNNESVETFCFSNNNNNINNNTVVTEANNNNNNNNSSSDQSFLLPRMQECDGPSDALIEEILMLAKKQTTLNVRPSTETVRINLASVPETRQRRVDKKPQTVENTFDARKGCRRLRRPCRHRRPLRSP